MKLKKIIQSCFVLVACLFMASAFAATNPLSFTVSPNGFPATTTVGSSYSVSYTITNNLPFAFPYNVPGALKIFYSYVGGSFAKNDHCYGRTLEAAGKPNSSCTVDITLHPSHVGKNSIQLTLAYGKDRVPLPIIATNSTSGRTPESVEGRVTPLPPTTFQGLTYKLKFIFSNDGSSPAIGTLTPSPNLVLGPGCTTEIAPDDHCTVEGTFTAGAPGPETASVTYNYTAGDQSGSVPVSTSTTVYPVGPDCHLVNIVPVLQFPAGTFNYSNHVLQFEIVNACPATAQTINSVTFETFLNGGTVDSRWWTAGDNHCNGQVLAPNGGSCLVDASVLMQATGNLSLLTTVIFDSTHSTDRQLGTIVSPIPNQTVSHNITFINQCPFPVWYEFANASGDGQDPTLYTTKTPTVNDYKLNKQHPGSAPTTKTLSNIPVYTGGAIYPRKNCKVNADNVLVCDTATCVTVVNQGQASGTCVQAGTQGSGAASPSTKMELAMTNTPGTDGIYDVSVINGMTVPTEMKGLGPSVPYGSGATPFQCTSAGAVYQPAGATLGNCSWKFPTSTMPDNPENFIWVDENTTDSCNSPCGANEFCGTGFAASNRFGGETPINRHCGGFLGYWTVSVFAGYPDSTQWGTNDLYSDYSLGNPLPPNAIFGSYGMQTNVTTIKKDFCQNPTPTNPAVVQNLYACQRTCRGTGADPGVAPFSYDPGNLNTGYNANVFPNPCGCYSWSTDPQNIAKTAEASQCQSTNADWTNTVLPRIGWLKKACPTSYTFQYDDPSSSFGCNDASKVNFTSYEVVFCPGGRTGAPDA